MVKRPFSMKRDLDCPASLYPLPVFSTMIHVGSIFHIIV